MPDFDSVSELTHRALHDVSAGWSIGTFGAIGEFTRDRGERVRVEISAAGATVVTARGALAMHLAPGLRVVAYEGLAKRAGHWLQGIELCLPLGRARGRQHRVMAEIGADHGAVRIEDRSAILFDLGLGVPHIDFHVRCSDSSLVRYLRRHSGEPLLETDPEVMRTIAAAHPHRVFTSALGRVEVYQRIGSADHPQPTPAGPHTHVLPGLLEAGRTHSANIPVPAGWVPCLSLYPAHPLADNAGRPHAFERDAYERFQRLLARYGAPEFVREKRRVLEAVDAGVAPGEYVPAVSRLGRLGARIALRQLTHLRPGDPWVDAWHRRVEADPANLSS